MNKMMYVYPTNLLYFSILVGLLYTLSGMGVSLRYPNISFTNYYFISFYFILLFITSIFFTPNKIFITFSSPYKVKLLSLLTFLFLLMFILAKSSHYGGFDKAFLVSYTERTGYGDSSIVNLFTFLLVGFSSILTFYTYINFKLYGKYSINILLVLFVILIFVIGGNRNLVLFILSITFSFIILRSSFNKILTFFILIYFLLVMVSWIRNFGLLMLLDGSVALPPLNYFDPSVHEFGTSANVYAIYESSTINFKYTLPSSYFFIFINLFSSIANEFNILSFSDKFSLVFANNGEGLGMSPVVEVLYSNGFGLPIQFLPFFIPFFIALRISRNNIFLSMLFFGLSLVASFNLWRIDFSVVLKLQFLILLFSSFCYYLNSIFYRIKF